MRSDRPTRFSSLFFSSFFFLFSFSLEPDTKPLFPYVIGNVCGEGESDHVKVHFVVGAVFDKRNYSYFAVFAVSG